MSILKTTNSGKLKIIQDELEKAYPENQNVNYRIVEIGNGEYKVVFSAKNGLGGVISLSGFHVNYKIDFENNPYVIFNFFEGENDLEKIDRLFDLKCYRFTFRYCKFSGNYWLKKALKWYDKIEHSSYFVPNNFFDKTMKNVPEEQYKHFIKNIKDYDNTIFINRYFDNNEIDWKSDTLASHILKNYSEVEFQDDFNYKVITL